MNESDRKTETSSLYCQTELTTAKKYDEPFITTEATRETQPTQRTPVQQEPGVIKQAKEEILRQLDEAADIFAKLQKQIRDEAREYEEQLVGDAEEIEKAKQ